MISFSKVTKQYGSQVLFVDASFQLDPGNKVALVGPNGAGKTTIFRLIEGEEAPDEGRIERPKRLSIGWFRQEVGDWTGVSTLEQTIAGAGEVASLRAELAHLEGRLGDIDADDYDDVLMRYGDVLDHFSVLGGYDLEARAARILAGLGLSPSQIDGPIDHLSGGWKMRVALAQVLLKRPEVLLLDEPTNHLDLESILWLEQFLRDYPGTVLLTSHDRDVLNRVVTRVLEIDGGQVRNYSGNYDFYELQRKEHAAQHEAEYERQQAMLAKELRFIERFRGQPSKSSAVQSRAKMIDKIERIQPPKRYLERDFDLRACARSGDDVLKVSGLSKRYGALVVHEDLNLMVHRGEAWAVMGQNGAGKSTLLRMLAGVDTPDQGEVVVGASVDMAYFAQHHAENLNPSLTVLGELEAAFPKAGVGVLKNLAGGFGFSGDDTDKYVSVLSGGEKTRLTLAKLLFANPNLLILDEPTNHLDLATKRMLVRALRKFQGTLVFVSHDRDFLRHLATRVLELVPGDPHLYPGSYTEYVQATGHEAPGMRAE
ncbi:MAG: ABC-F family ATP-binding cassette domain-containing protein [Deltaproteobacteria bacterium]|nr:ABC-F family ATP-binding cassette domain-containing protein [Deltaproteobacteria bacterium]